MAAMSDQANLKTVDDAWAFFTARVIENIRGVNRRTMSVESAQKDDELLSAFISDHAGAFEQRLIAGLSELAMVRWTGGEPASALDELADADVPEADGAPEVRGGPIDATLRALDPLNGLRLCWLLIWQHHAERARWAAEFFAERLKLKRTPTPPELPPELCDAVSQLDPNKDPAASLPDVLPMDLDGWSPRDIEVALERYVGLPVEHIEARLRAGVSGVVSLGSEERLGALIWQDAAALRALKVKRHALADRLERCIRTVQFVPPEYDGVEGWVRWSDEWHVVSEIGAAFNVEVQWRGSWVRDNPLSTIFGDVGSTHFAVRNPALGSDRMFKGCDLALGMIRRFCFFEGQPGERIDPSTAARVLGLVS